MEEPEDTTLASFAPLPIQEDARFAYISRSRRAAKFSCAAAAEQVGLAAAAIYRQMSALPAEAQRLRTAAANLNVEGALSNIPEIQSMMFRIADYYEVLACISECRYDAYLRKHAREEQV
jgi:hypothetical protein